MGAGTGIPIVTSTVTVTCQETKLLTIGLATGIDVSAIKTRAVRQGDDFVINGSKHFISHAHESDFVILFAQTDLSADGGDVELIDIDGKNIYVRLSGACSGCQMASVTIEASAVTA